MSKVTDIVLGLWCLTSLSIIFQLFRGGQFYICRSPDFPEKTMHWPVASHWIVWENHVLTCHKSLNCPWKPCTHLSLVTEIVGENHVLTCHTSVNCQWKPCTDLSQVTELCVKTMRWPVTSHWIVRENHTLTCHKSLNCQRKPCTNLLQVTELLEKTMY